MSYSVLRAAGKLLKSTITFPKYYSTATHAANIDPLLDRLDNDVRKFGRIYRKDLDEVLEEFRQKETVTSSQSLLIIRCCGSLVQDELPETRTNLVKQVWKILSKRGVPLDISHYNALLRVYIENEHEFSPSEFLKDLETKGITPNRVTYQRLMWRHCQKGDVEGASQILELMKEQQMPLNSIVLDALVLGHVKQGDIDGAKSVLSAMSAAGISPSARTYTLLIRGLVANNQMEEIQKFIEECKTKEIHLSDKDILDIVEECMLIDDKEKITYFLDKLERGPGYNQEAINLILRLITKGQEQAAIAILKTMSPVDSQADSEGLNNYAGSFFIKQLIKLNVPNEKFISICEQLKKERLSPNAFYIATELALQNKKPSLALSLLEKLKEEGHEIRHHYFWPIFTGLKNKNDAISGVIDQMYKNFKIGMNSETLRDYIIPNISTTKSDKIMETLRKAGVGTVLASRTLIYNLLDKEKLREAAEVAKTYNTPVNMRMCNRLLVRAFIADQDVDSLITILHLSCNEENILNNKDSENQNEAESECGMLENQKEALGQLLYNLVSSPIARTNFEEILSSLCEKGLGIQTELAEKIQEALPEDTKPEVLELLNKLTSSDLEFQTLERQSIPTIQKSPEQIEARIKSLEDNGETVIGLYKTLLNSYLNANDVNKVKELLEKMEQKEFVFTVMNINTLLDFFAKHEDLQYSLKFKDIINTKYPDFQLSPTIIMRLCKVLIKENQFEEALKLISSKADPRLSDKLSFLNRYVCWQTLDTLTSQGPEKLNQFFNLAKENGYLEINNQVLGPLVKVHMLSNDLTSALSAFEECCRLYRCTPWKNELTKHLINIEDATGLQKLTDLSTSVHGEINSLYDLVFGFVECGRLKQARRILETPGMRTRNQRFSIACEKYGQSGKIEYLEGLLEATKDLSHIDRTEVFQQLLNHYTKGGDTEKALGLWTLLQEDSITPTDDFLVALANHLRSKNMKVPFAVPESVILETPEKINTQKQQIPRFESKGNVFLKKFEKLVNENHINDCVKLVHESNLSTADKENVSRKIKFLINSGNLQFASNLTIALLDKNIVLGKQTFEDLLFKLAATGNFEALKVYDGKLDEDKKRELKFTSKYSSCLLKTGKIDELIKTIDNMLTETTDIAAINQKLPKGVLLALIDSNPDAASKVEELAVKFHAKGSNVLGNLFWEDALIKGNMKQAQHYFDKYLISQPDILFRKVLNFCVENKNVEKLDQVLKFVAQTNITQKSLAGIYNTKIKIYLMDNKLSEIENTIENALDNGLSINDLSEYLLHSVKTANQKGGKEFKYEFSNSTNTAESNI